VCSKWGVPHYTLLGPSVSHPYRLRSLHHGRSRISRRTPQAVDDVTTGARAPLTTSAPHARLCSAHVRVATIEYSRYKSVQNTGDEEGGYVEDSEIGEVESGVLVTWQLQHTRLDGLTVRVDCKLRRHKGQPGGTVDDAEDPQGYDDTHGSPHGTHGLGLHWVTDGDVALYSERSDRQGRDIDA